MDLELNCTLYKVSTVALALVLLHMYMHVASYIYSWLYINVHKHGTYVVGSSSVPGYTPYYLSYKRRACIFSNPDPELLLDTVIGLETGLLFIQPA